MTNLFLIVFGFLELLLRIVLMVAFVASIIGILVIIIASDDHDVSPLDLLRPYLWELLRENMAGVK